MSVNFIFNLSYTIIMNPIYFLDLVGIFAFSAYGTFVGIKKKLDIFGVFICAFLTALGGGTLRELILGNIPFYFYDNNYLLIILAGILFSIIFYKVFHKINKYMLIIDAVGLSTFALIGASKAAELSLGAFAIITLATVNAVGGGLIRDIVVREVPQILYKDFYASPAVFLGILYALFRNYASSVWIIGAILSLTFLLRVYAILSNLNLWVPGIKNTNSQK